MNAAQSIDGHQKSDLCEGADVDRTDPGKSMICDMSGCALRLHGIDPEEAVLELNRLTAEGTRVRDLRVSKDTAIGALQEKIDECRKSRNAAVTFLRETDGRLKLS